MAELKEIIKQYQNVPNDLKILKRWVCFKIVNREGKNTKIPINAISGKNAKCNDQLTWTNFDVAIRGVEKYNCNGLGFMLGDGIFGIDLDDVEEDVKNEFINKINSYTERSVSGKGIHIICYGKLPEGRRRKGKFEMYDKDRFFAFTGDAIKNVPIFNREQEVIELWEKYINYEDSIDEHTTQTHKYDFTQPSTPTFNSNYKTVYLNDEEVIETILNSRQREEFSSLFYNGDMSFYGNDHSAADAGLCCILAFWTNGNHTQIDRLFRKSALMRKKWDEKRGADTYGNITINSALRRTTQGYVKKEYNVATNKIFTPVNPKEKKILSCVSEPFVEMNLDKNGEPIFRIKRVFKSYGFSDTENAKKFYDYFGHLFKYNVTDKVWMFWTGKKWIKDDKDVIKKYANKLIEINHEDEKAMKQKIIDLTNEGKNDEAKLAQELWKNSVKNTSRIGNTAGKEAMLKELRALYDIPVSSDEFDKDPFLLNTDSGTINLKTGEIRGFNPNDMLSMNTNIKISYEEPTEWIKFLHSIFKRDNEQETKEIVDFIQIALGYNLTGITDEQGMFICYGDGSNGKSTFSQQITRIMGDYADSVDSDILMNKKVNNSGSNPMNSIAKLRGKRYVETGETEEGGKLSEAFVKKITAGNDRINARFLYGNEFSFLPNFKIWMSTNNKPIIRGADYAIWRRIFPIPFLRRFAEEEKDRDLPRKLEVESSQILGWCIKGVFKYFEKKRLDLPQCLQEEKRNYKIQMDVVSQFINKRCLEREGSKVECRLLYQTYKEWSIDNTEYTEKESKFSEKMIKKGFKIKTDYCDHKQYYEGLEIIGMKYSF